MTKKDITEVLGGVLERIIPLILLKDGIEYSQIFYLILISTSTAFLDPFLALFRKLYSLIANKGNASSQYSVIIDEYLLPAFLWGFKRHPCKGSPGKNFKSKSTVMEYRGDERDCNIRDVILLSDPNSGDKMEYKGEIFTVSKVEIVTADEYSGKDKKSTHYVLRGSSAELIHEFLHNTSRDYANDFYDKYRDKKRDFKNPVVFKYDTGDSEWEECTLAVSKTFKNVFLEEEAELKIRKRMELLSDEDYYKRTGKPKKACFLLSGLPGCGKSSTSFAIAQEYRHNIYVLNLKALHKRVDFNRAVNGIEKGSMVIIEEIDTINLKRKGEKKGEKYIGLSDILELLDGYYNFKDCVVILTTNHPERLDPALIRQGRVDLHIEYQRASLDVLTRILTYFLPQCKLDAETLSKYDKKLTSSAIINICEMVSGDTELLAALDEALKVPEPVSEPIPEPEEDTEEDSDDE
nr:AAA-ATPase [Kaumoebavirus]